jgi:adenylate cyclase
MDDGYKSDIPGLFPPKVKDGLWREAARHLGDSKPLVPNIPFSNTIPTTPPLAKALLPPTPGELKADSKQFIAAMATAGQKATGTIPQWKPLLEVVTSADVEKASQRLRDRIERNQSDNLVRDGRVAPEEDDLAIGSARRLRMTLLFVDICKFSALNSFTEAEQQRVLHVLNLFLAEVLWVLRARAGRFEKNTGDGVMAYFEGEDAQSTLSAVKSAIEMHYYNDYILAPGMRTLGLPELKFRVGIDVGHVLVGNVGVRGVHRSLVAIGNPANIACKAMSLIPNGGIVLGDTAQKCLPTDLRESTRALGQIASYVYVENSELYRGWELTYRQREIGPTSFEIVRRAVTGL